MVLSPVSSVFHTVETVRLSLNSNTPTPDIKMSMLDCRALKFFSYKCSAGPLILQRVPNQ